MKKLIVFLFLGMMLALGPKAALAQEVSETQGAAVVTPEVTAPAEEKISLDIKGMEVADVIKLLANKAKMSIIIGANVKGNVTMFLDDVNVSDAFELILVSNGLAKDVRNGIAYILTDREYMQIYGKSYSDQTKVKVVTLKYADAPSVSQALMQVKSVIGKVIVDAGSNTIILVDNPEVLKEMTTLLETIDKPTKTVVYELDYAHVKEIKERMAEIITVAGSVQIDERTNRLVVTDVESNFGRIEQTIKAFDAQVRQVLIEAKIVEITLTDAFQYGVDWTSVIRKYSEELNIKNSFKITSKGNLSPGNEIAFGTLNSDVSGFVQVLKTIGDTNILSSPRITALNDEEANILVGSNEPYATNTVTQGTSTTSTATTLTFLDIGIKLYVTPHINKDGYVTIKIRPEVSSNSGTYTYGDPPTTVPIISTTKAETSVMVKDGTTIIIAGLIKDDRQGNVSKVPILGDIPLLGAAFRKEDNQIQKKELVIFLTPRILSPDQNYTDAPTTPPTGEKMFTMPEGMTFERRNPVTMDPEYFHRKFLNQQGSVADDLAGSPMHVYDSMIKDKIIKNLRVGGGKHLKDKDLARVSFDVNSKGRLTSVPRITEGKNKYLNKALVRAVKKAAPFPAFPSAMTEQVKTFTLDVVYEPEHKAEGGQN